MITPVEITIAVDLLAKAHKEGWLERLLDGLKKKHRVLVLGASGTGKSNFVQSLEELLPAAIDRLNRTEFLKEHAIKIGHEPFRFIDTPGQLEHVSKRMEAYREAMKDGIDGVINVTSYGYHEGRAGLETVFDANGNVKEEFLQTRRDAETVALKEWGTILGPTDVTRWIMTVVTKADLWWSFKDKVITHYQSGEYEKLLRSFHPNHASVLPYCSVVHKFYGRTSISGDFDDADRSNLRSHLLRELLAAVSH